MPPSPNSNANPKSNPDPDRGQFSGHHQIHTFNNNLNDEGIITSHLMRVIFYDKNVTTFSRMIEKPWQNMLHEKTILKG